MVEAKAGAGSATLSMAYAAARFAGSCLRAMAGEPGVTECAFVKSGLAPPLPFFASPLRLGPAGVSEFLPLGERMCPVAAMPGSAHTCVPCLSCALSH